MMIEREKELYQMNADDSTTEKGGPIDVRIFAVSKKVFAEAVKVFYKINILRVVISHDHNLALFMSACTGRESPRPSIHLKRINLWVYFNLIESKR